MKLPIWIFIIWIFCVALWEIFNPNWRGAAIWSPLVVLQRSLLVGIAAGTATILSLPLGGKNLSFKQFFILFFSVYGFCFFAGGLVNAFVLNHSDNWRDSFFYGAYWTSMFGTPAILPIGLVWLGKKNNPPKRRIEE